MPIVLARVLPPGLRGGLAAAMLGFFISTVRRAPPRRAPSWPTGGGARALRGPEGPSGGLAERGRGRAGGRQHTTYIHAWGSTLVQDVVVPLYGAEHVSPAQQARPCARLINCAGCSP